jgi:hypothetical protein
MFSDMMLLSFLLFPGNTCIACVTITDLRNNNDR